ncbi:MAG: MarR family transcriptional regulator [Coriobacteriia bacterium]|nr:MarR family transcriptional regulator [Coriobacteriia bacterium]
MATTEPRHPHDAAHPEGPHPHSEYLDQGERGQLISQAIGSFNQMKRVLEERLERRHNQGNSPIKYSPFQGQGRIIMALSPDDPMSQADLARKLEIRPQTLSTALKKLESAQLITRSTHPLDARVYLVGLTPRGQDLKDRLSTEEKYSGSMFEALDDAELTSFAACCCKLADHLRAEIEANKAVLELLSDQDR